MVPAPHCRMSGGSPFGRSSPTIYVGSKSDLKQNRREGPKTLLNPPSKGERRVPPGGVQKLVTRVHAPGGGVQGQRGKKTQ